MIRKYQNNNKEKSFRSLQLVCMYVCRTIINNYLLILYTQVALENIQTSIVNVNILK